jgi:hypothetical protein
MTPFPISRFGHNNQALTKSIVVTYKIRVFFEGAKKEVFSSIFKKTLY